MSYLGGGYGSYGQRPPGQPGSQAPPGYSSGGYPAPYSPGYPPPRPTYSPGYPPQPQPQYAPPQQQNAYYSMLQPHEINQLRAWFAAVDKDHSGRISVEELSSMNFGPLRFSLETSRLLIKVFDREQCGEIGFYEYASLHKFILLMNQAFQTYDADRSGTIEINEVQMAVQQGGFSLTPITLQLVFKKFHNPRTKGLNLEQFMGLCAFLGMGRSAFTQLDFQRTGQVHMDMDQFIKVVATLC
eukprot:TRINITY_DN17317_c0_g1_i1.p1 TRINITY_DN17317_c0_g1~~TRINITY_DN17317_c0_g1_i1.p1  ORF type:complete len:251 (+),score=25.93 TRINITY_DN17317_c0_g1_i1:30-755(+)